MTTSIRGGRSVQAASTLVFTVCLLAPTSGARQDVRGEEVRPQAIALFDGSSLAGWLPEHTNAQARDGVLAVEQGSGWVRTEQPFADFVLKLEFRMTGSAARAGMFVRAWPTFDAKTSVPNNGYRVSFNGGQRSGRDTSQPTAWRRVEIEVIGHTLRVHLDGELVHQRDDLGNPQGHIGLFSERGRAEFRQLVVERRKASTRSTPSDEAAATSEGINRPGAGIINPRVRREVKPRYTADAMRARIQGAVLLEAVVLRDGTVGRVTIVQSLDPKFGLDEEAVGAARQWRFEPGTRDGEPVAVLVTIELTFTLK